jgi:hypothetical protein
VFTIPKTNVIESSDGFSVEVLGRTGLRYIDHGRVMNIDSEVLAGPSGLVLYSNSIRKWIEPHENESVDETVRRQIIENVREAFRFRDLEIQVQ